MESIREKAEGIFDRYPHLCGGDKEKFIYAYELGYYAGAADAVKDEWAKSKEIINRFLGTSV